MQHLKNQLNKVKCVSENASKSCDHDIPASSAFQILNLIYEDSQGFEGKKVLILNSSTGILPIGVKLLNPLIVVLLLKSMPNGVLKDNLSQFSSSTDVVVSSYFPFHQASFDLGIIGPVLDKAQATDISSISLAQLACKKLYCVYKSVHQKVLLEKHRQSEIVGSVNIKMPGYSNYSKQNAGSEEFVIFRIK